MINNELIVESEIEISASPEDIWEAIINPDIVQQYFFGTRVRSGWQKGSPLVFYGSWEGKSFEDKGVIQEVIAGLHLKYTYWSSFSGLPDREENYSLVTYDLTPTSRGTKIRVRQKGFSGDEAHNHSVTGWQQVLSGMKRVVESRNRG